MATNVSKENMICELIKHNVYNWHSLGSILKIPPRQLQYIEAEHRNSPLSKKVSEVICTWWVQCDDEPSWEKLGLALQSIPDHEDIGDKILQTYCPHLISPIPPVRLLPRSGGEGVQTPPETKTITDQPPPVQKPTISSQYLYQNLVPTSHYPYASVPATPCFQPHQVVHNPSIMSHSSLQYPTTQSMNNMSGLRSPTFTQQQVSVSPQSPQVFTQHPPTSSQYPYQNLVPTSHYPYASAPATPYFQPHQVVHNPSIMSHSSLQYPTTQPMNNMSGLRSPTFTQQQVSFYSPQSPQVYTQQPPPPHILLPPVNLLPEHPLMFSSYRSLPSLTEQPIGAVDCDNISSLHSRGLADSSQLPNESSSNLSQQQSLPIATPSLHSGSSSSLTEDYRQQPVSGYDTASVVSISESDKKFQKQKAIALRQISRLRGKYAALTLKVIEIFENEQIDMNEVKHFVLFALPTYDFNFLEDHLKELQKKETPLEVFLFLKRFTSFNNYGLMQCIIEKFIDKQAGQLLEEYIAEHEDFVVSCPLADYALAYTEAAAKHTMLTPNSVAVHLDNRWEQRMVHEARQFQYREFHQFYVPEMSFNMTRCEQRTIFIAWETTEIVIKKLLKDCSRRFSHLRTQGVLQLIIGPLEIDFTAQKRGPPNFYKLEVNVWSSQRQLARTTSSLTVCSHGSTDTQRSGESKESGYHSGAMSLLSIAGTISEKDLADGEIKTSFSDLSDQQLSVQKGERVKIISIKDQSAYVKTEKGLYGLVPLSIVKYLPKVPDSGQPIRKEHSPSLQTIAPEQITITRTKLDNNSLSDIENITPPSSPNLSEQRRPDTPPLEAYMEASNVELSDHLNSKSKSESPTTVLNQEEYLKRFYPEIPIELYGTKSWKTFARSVIKYVRPKWSRRTDTQTVVSGSHAKIEKISFHSLRSKKLDVMAIERPKGRSLKKKESIDTISLSNQYNSPLSMV